MNPPIQYKKPRDPKAPPIDTAGKAAIAGFLEFMLERTSVSLNDHRVLQITDKSKRIKRFIDSLRDRIRIIRFLANINDQRNTTDGKPDP